MHSADVAAVRREKEMDTRTRAHLIAQYGAGPIGPGGARRLTRPNGWHCGACGRTSTDARRVCGFCLAPEPGVRQGAASRAANASSLMCPGRSQDPSVRLMAFPHGRCYRTAAVGAEGFGGARERRRGEGPLAHHTNTNAQDEEGEEDEPDCVVDHVEDNEHVPTTRENAERNYNRRPVYTHFVSLPIGRLSSVRPNAAALLDALRSRCNGQTAQVPVEVLSSAPRLHFTLLMLELPTSQSREIAAECMKALRERLRGLAKERWDVRLGGLHVMRGRGRNEARADVLYMGFRDKQSQDNVAELQKMVHECFAELVVNDSRALQESKLLHMTLMNSKWGGTPTHRAVFDASEIMQHMRAATLCGGEEDGAIRLEYIDLNKRAYDAEKECYTCECVVEL